MYLLDDSFCVYFSQPEDGREFINEISYVAWMFWLVVVNLERELYSKYMGDFAKISPEIKKKKLLAKRADIKLYLLSMFLCQF